MNKTGFDFENYPRNQKLDIQPKTLKTGTTIAAAVFDGGVVLGADTRATAGPVVAVKDEYKIHYISDNIWCCGAGTAADNDEITRLISSKLRLFTMNTGMQPRVYQCAQILAARLFKYMGYIGAYLIVAGVDFQGPSAYTIYANGSCSKSPFTTLGSGSMAAVSVLEQRWRSKMSEADCKELVADAIEAGITNDLGSGSCVNLCVIKNTGHEYISHYRVTNERQFRMNMPSRIGTVEVISTVTKPLHAKEVHLDILDDAPPAEAPAQ
ncbi:hypothetical protein M9Y10_033969 [Tritrichomonas musculus]|uniref:proteasome endopeptidase complex n=1 Tax=Tritrichomonas musculus TaxID=1915356 RepID=A0ABR2KDL5_9EUKA